MDNVKQEYKDLGKSIKSAIRYLKDEPNVDTIEMRMHNRRIIISHIQTEQGEFYNFTLQRAIPKDQLEGVKEELARDLKGSTLIRNKILMSELILSREAYEALIVGFFKFENPDMSTDMKVVITEKTN